MENTLLEVETVQTQIAIMHSLREAKTFCYNFIILVEERKMNENYSKGASRIPKKEETMYLCSKYGAVHTIYESIIE